MMEIIYFRDPEGNFGDDLNADLWPALLPQDVLDSDRVRLLGIGSILNATSLARAGPSHLPTFVLGSGTSYGRPPHDLNGLTVNAVRGPFTARALGHPEAAVTDGAVLMAATPGFLPAARAASGIVYVPHHKSLWRGHWKRVAETAGMTFIDPRWSVAKVLRVMASAKLVIAEAMHGAIFADTLRIPWIPIVGSPRIDAFKWRDWTLSMEQAYNPIMIPSSTWVEAQEVRQLQQTEQMRMEAFKLGDHATQAELVAYLTSRHPESAGVHKAPLTASMRRIVLAGSRLAANVTHVSRAAEALSKAANGPQYLSRDAVFSSRLSRMMDGVQVLTKMA
jgi:succinoglycan biosynthesis protein ExoV